MEHQRRAEVVIAAFVEAGHGSRLHFDDRGCLVWTGARHERGYGRIRWKGRMLSTGRAAWEVDRGRSFPDGRRMAWSCGNRACIHPEHLSVATRAPAQTLSTRTVPRTVEEADRVLEHIDAQLVGLDAKQGRLIARQEWLLRRRARLKREEKAA